MEPGKELKRKNSILSPEKVDRQNWKAEKLYSVNI
jgi:hypothetical protein